MDKSSFPDETSIFTHSDLISFLESMLFTGGTDGSVLEPSGLPLAQSTPDKVRQAANTGFGEYTNKKQLRKNNESEYMELILIIILPYTINGPQSDGNTNIMTLIWLENTSKLFSYAPVKYRGVSHTSHIKHDRYLIQMDHFRICNCHPVNNLRI